jgi:hypothetical protein
MEGKMESALIESLTWREWFWLAGLAFIVFLSIYAIWQFFKIVWRKE